MISHAEPMEYERQKNNLAIARLDSNGTPVASSSSLPSEPVPLASLSRTRTASSKKTASSKQTRAQIVSRTGSTASAKEKENVVVEDDGMIIS
jgi:hypothetical protein